MKSAMAVPSASNHSSSDLSSDFRNEPLTEQVTHMTTGHAMFIDTKHRLARVYVTNPDILDSYTASPNEVVVTAKKPGIASLILWDESGEAKTYLISSDINVEGLRASIQRAVPNEVIDVQSSEGRVLLSGTVATPALLDTVSKLAGIYGKDVSNALVVNSALVKQVKLEVRMVEVDRSKMNSFGFNFFSAGGNNLAQTSTNQYSSTMQVTTGGTTGGKTVALGNPLNFSLYSSKLNIGATLQDLETMQVLQILAEPTITAMSGQKANFLAGGEFPFPVVQGSSTGGTSVSIMFRPYGVKLEFTPKRQCLTGRSSSRSRPRSAPWTTPTPSTSQGYTIPALSTRKAETEVVLRSGQTFAISGLLDKRTTDSYAKTPGIASVPILGELFKSKGVTHSNTELVVIVTPTIVDPLTSEPTISEPQTVIPLLDQAAFSTGRSQQSRSSSSTQQHDSKGRLPL